MPDDRGTGVGLSSMRERAAELGGTLVVAAGVPHGTVVTAVLPYRSVDRRPSAGRLTMDPIRLVIADDSRQFRAGLRALLSSAADLEVIGEAADGEHVVAMATSLQPDVIMMDLQMPGLGGIEATRRILRSSPHISVLVLSMFDDDDSIFAALQAGARGYLLKGAVKSEILRAIRAVASGEAIFGPDIAKRLIDYFATPRPSAPTNAFPQLTEREHQILALVAQHQTNPQIARQPPTEPQDNPQPRIERLHQAPGSRSSRSNPARPAGGTRWQPARSRLGGGRHRSERPALIHAIPHGRGSRTSRVAVKARDW